MKSEDMQVVIQLLNAHLETINIAIYMVGFIVTVIGGVAIYFTWRNIKTTITEKVEIEVKKLAEKERENIKRLIVQEVKRVGKEEGNTLYEDINITAGLKGEKVI